MVTDNIYLMSVWRSASSTPHKGDRLFSSASRILWYQTCKVQSIPVVLGMRIGLFLGSSFRFPVVLCFSQRSSTIRIISLPAQSPEWMLAMHASFQHTAEMLELNVAQKPLGSGDACRCAGRKLLQILATFLFLKLLFASAWSLQQVLPVTEKHSSALEEKASVLD